MRNKLAKTPAVIVRFRSQRQFERIKRQARKLGVSLNAFIVAATDARAEQMVQASAATPEPIAQ